MFPSNLLIVVHIYLICVVFKHTSAFTPSWCRNILEERRECGPKCPIACDTLNTTVCCDVACVSGCFCKDGLILASSVGLRKCVAINDCPKPGILEFQSSTVTVLESAKLIVIPIVRVNGSAGVISIRWHTVEGSAREQADFIPSSGNVFFADGVTARDIQIAILEDDVWEPDEYFSVVLSNPTNKAEISARGLDKVRVNIIDDDMRPGYLDLANTNITVPENIGTVSITVLRLGGSDGLIQIRYRTVDGTALAQQDYEPTSGTLTFNGGQTRKAIQLKIKDDDVREFLESFEMQLFDATAAPGVINFRSLSSTPLRSVINIVDNDMRPGYLSLAPTNITVPENIGTVTITVSRLHGSDGLIHIRYRTVDGTALAQQDYQPTSGILTFKDGQISNSIQLTITNDGVRESPESFQLQFSEPTAAPGVINFRQPTSTTLMSVITIQDDDFNPGIFQFQIDRITVPEDIGFVRLTVVRLQGSDGEVTIQVRTSSITATEGIDFVRPAGTITLQDGVNKAAVEMRFLDDEIEEADKEILVGLFSPSNGGVLGNRTVVTIVIKDNDAPSIIQFQQRSSSVQEGRPVEMIVIRENNLDKSVSVKWRTEDETARAGEDYIGTSRALLTFMPREDRKRILVPTIDNSRREGTEFFNVDLFDPSKGAKLGVPSRYRVEIVDDDEEETFNQAAGPPRTTPPNSGPIQVFFTLTNIRVREDAGEVQIPISRIGGLEPFTVQLRTLDGTAIKTRDYQGTQGRISFGKRDIQFIISIRIFDNDVFEPDKTFVVMMHNPSVGTVLRGQNSVTVTIVNDDGITGGGGGAVSSAQSQQVALDSPSLKAQSYGGSMEERQDIIRGVVVPSVLLDVPVSDSVPAALSITGSAQVPVLGVASVSAQAPAGVSAGVSADLALPLTIEAGTKIGLGGSIGSAQVPVLGPAPATVVLSSSLEPVQGEVSFSAQAPAVVSAEVSALPLRIAAGAEIRGSTEAGSYRGSMEERPDMMRGSTVVLDVPVSVEAALSIAGSAQVPDLDPAPAPVSISSREPVLGADSFSAQAPAGVSAGVSAEVSALQLGIAAGAGIGLGGSIGPPRSQQMSRPLRRTGLIVL